MVSVFSKNDGIMTNSVSFTHHLAEQVIIMRPQYWAMLYKKLHTPTEIKDTHNNTKKTLKEIFEFHIRVQILNDHSLIQLNNKKKSLYSSIWNFFFSLVYH